MHTQTFLILSDTHGRADRIREVLRRVRPDGLLFAGDGLRDLSSCDLPCPLWGVKGNCDWVSSALILQGGLFEPKEEELVTLSGLRILLTHGHRYGVKGGPAQAITRGVQREADVLIFGHTHVPLELHLSPEENSPLAVTKPLTVFNPGSLGDDRHPSFGTLTIRGGVPLLAHGEL